MKKLKFAIGMIMTVALVTGMFAFSTPTTAYAGFQNPAILKEAEEIALSQGYGLEVPVTVGDKVFAYTDHNGISGAIKNLAAATGDDAVVNSSFAIDGCHLCVESGNWFAMIGSTIFHAAFPGHDQAAYYQAQKATLNQIDEIFAQICAERGLNENGYPIVAPTPTPTPVTPVDPAPPAPTPTPAPAATPTPAAKIPTSGGVGKAYTIVPSAPRGYTMQSASYASTNPNVVTVDSVGNVTFVGGGKATVVIKVVSQKTDKRGRIITKTTTIKKKITVKQLVDSISLSASEATISKAQKLKLSASFSPTTASNKKVKWTSSNKRVATVSSSGVVVGKGPGTAVITCTARDGSGASASCAVTVTPVYPTGVKLSKPSLVVKIGKTVSLSAAVAPRNTDFKTVTWTSSDAAIATVDARGKVKGLAPGTVTITATTSNGLIATSLVTVQ